MKWLGVLALAFYAVHCAWHIRQGHAEDTLWACHVAAALVGVGLLGGWATCVAVGVMWLAVGVPLWLLDVATGGEFSPTSVLTHVGGLVVGLIGLWQLGMPAGVWWKALLALAALQQLCRWVTPAEANVNVAFSVYPWMKVYFSSYWLYYAAMLPLFGLLFFVSEVVLRKLLPGLPS
jgi:hypothetical protein